MAKLSKQDKIEIFNLWQNYQVGTTELCRRYQVNPSTINYLLALINRHGTAILDRPYTSYSIAFKEQAIRRVLVKDEAIYQVALDLGLKSYGMLSNCLREYRKNGYNIVNHKKERPPHVQTKSGNRTVKARNPALTPAELNAENRERICKKLSVLVDQRIKNRKPRK